MNSLLKKTKECSWIDPTMKAGNYVTDSLLASVYIAMGCTEFKISFEALLTSWHRMLNLCKKTYQKVKNEDIKIKFYMIAMTIASQGQSYEKDRNNFVYDLFINSKSQCKSGSLLLYAIFEALEPDILKDVYFMTVPAHIFLLLYNKNEKNWTVFESTYFMNNRIPRIENIKTFKDINEILYGSNSINIEYYTNDSEEKDTVGTTFPILIYKSPYVTILNSTIFFRDRVPNRIWKKFTKVMSHLNFCDYGYIQKLYCLTIQEDGIERIIFDDMNLPESFLRNRFEKLYKKVVHILCKETPFKNFFFRDAKTINTFIGGIRNMILWDDNVEKWVYEYLSENKIDIPNKPIHTKFSS